MTRCQVTEEPDEVKVSRPVLKTRGFREELAEFTSLGSDSLEALAIIFDLAGGGCHPNRSKQLELISICFWCH